MAATVHQHVVVEDGLQTQLVGEIEDIKIQLGSIMARFLKIVRSVRKTRYADDYESPEQALEDDLQKLQDMHAGLDNVKAKHPYCYGCSGDGMMANQQAHMDGCMVDTDDHTDIEKALDALLQK